MNMDEALAMADKWHIPGRPTVESVLAEEVRRLRAVERVLGETFRVQAAELTELRAMRARAQHLAQHHPDPAAAGAALQILGGS